MNASPHFLFCCLVILAGRLAASEAKPLLDDSKFDPSMEASEADKFLRLTAKQPGKLVSAYFEIPVAGVKALQFSYRIRYIDVKRGAQPWFDARIILDFKNAKGDKIDGGPSHPYYTGTSDGWRQENMRFAVPAGAETLAVMPALFQAESGTLDLKNVSLIPIDPSELPPADAHGAADVKVDAGGPALQPLHVNGKQVLRADGSEMWLQGVCVDSLQWSTTGDSVIASIATAVEGWKANVVRLPMLEDRWFGRAQGQNDNGASYRSVIAQAVKAASSRGAYLIIDLHQFGAPREEHCAFWKSCAETYKDDPAVIFELFNEPHDISWNVWKDGGAIGAQKKDPAVLAEKKSAPTADHSSGMQALVDAVRNTGAKNIVLVGGLDWSYDLSGILNGFALNDRGGHGIVYVSHVYPWKSNWQHSFLDVAAKFPVIITEVGCDKVRYDFVPPERFENPYTWAPDMIACIQKNHLHWTAFSFHPNCGPSMITNFDNYEPTPFWGAFVRTALLGGKFQSDKLR